MELLRTICGRCIVACASLLSASTSVQACVTDADCEDGNPCTVDTCLGGRCVFEPADERVMCRPAADECDVPEYCTGLDSYCPTDVFAPGGTACGDPTDNDCTNPDTCDGAGMCLDNHEVDGTICTDDGNDCTEDACAGGTCTHPNSSAGTACGDPTDNDCTNPDTCDGIGACLDNHEIDGTSCTNDGNDCTEDVCASGVCTHPNSPLGAPCGDPTGDDCTNPDTCDGAGTCLDNHEVDGTVCTDDGNDCTEDACAGGTCMHPNSPTGTSCGDPTDDDCTNPDTCDGSGACFDNHEPDGTVCADDGDGCTDDLCAAGACTHPDSSAGTACGDPTDDDCTNPDTCDGAGTCLDNHEVDGTICTDDGNDCTSDVCAVGVCTHPNSSAAAACGDPTDDDCTNPDTCDGAGTCLDNHEVDGTGCTDDGNACTDDMCASGVCTHPNSPLGAPCGDPTDDDCTNPDTCDGAGTCLDNHEVDGTICTDDGNDCTEDVCAGGTCTHPNSPTGTSCGDPTDTYCDNPDTCDGAGTCLSNYEPSSLECRASAGPCDVAEYCTGASAACPIDSFEPSTTQCRASAGICDVAESCTGTSPACPGDSFQPSTTECRAALGTCDIAEFCTGISPACPGDVLEPNTTECRPAADICDVAELCDGTSVVCPTNAFEPSTTECRASAGPCDIAEFCTGFAAACPSDALEPNTVECRASAGLCDTAEFCSGAEPACPPDVRLPLGTECRPVAGGCDIAESCDGVSASCPMDEYLAAFTECRPAAGPCDKPEYCTGFGPDCGINGEDALEPAGTVCRAAAGSCDVEEVCDGVSLSCPADEFEPAGTVCRAEAGDCDLAELCNGLSASCPADSFQPFGTACGDPTDDECTNPDTCNVAGVCLDNHEADGTACTDDGNECTDDVCAAGACAHPDLLAGEACGDPIDDDCDNPDTCDGAGACADNLEPDGTVCTDDGDECTNDVCGAGVCTHAIVCGACCLPDGGCADGITSNDCTAQNGTWSEGLVCLDDMDGNGINDVCEQADFSPCEIQNVVASDPTADANFGYAAAVSGGLAVVGVRFDSDTGAAYVYRREGAGWVEEAKLVASDLGVGDLFGTAVAISDELVVVGASQHDDGGNNSGSAYVFRREAMSWVEEAKLVASDAAVQDRFGISLGLSGDAIVVGASLDDDAGSASGSAYVFRRSAMTWTQEAKLTASDADTLDQFGSAVSIDGNLLVVGSPADGDAGPASGSAYVFRWNGSDWVEEYKLVASDAESNDWFGSSVAVGGQLILVGSMFDDEFQSNSGSAYIFRRETPLWVEEAKLTASDPGVSHQFGFAVAISGSLALIGAFQDDDAGTSSGSAYMFRRSGVAWVDQTKLTSFDAAPGDQFGHSVSISGIVALVGAAFDDDGGADSGSVYFFDLTGPDSDGDGVLDVCDACPNFDDAADADGDGVPDGCDACPGFDDSLDCDADGTPDGCAIAQCSSGPACQDCNGNGVPDGCDIAAGASLDVNGNGMPDECESFCLPPVVEPVGSRYIAITPQPDESDVDVSFLITSPADWPCLSMYVGGFLECGETGRSCRTIADCNSCTGPLGGSCLIDDDCKTCQDAIGNPCETDEDCDQGVLCQLTETCDITGDNCAPHLPLDTIDVNEDGLVDGIVASLVNDPADAVSMKPQEWSAGAKMCSVSFIACTDDSDCDVGVCSISGTACSLAGQDCDNVCAIGQWECEVDSHCTLPGDTCTVPQTCEAFETCDPGKLYVTAEAVRPSSALQDGAFVPTTYELQAQCGVVFAPVEVTLRVWGDINDNHIVNMTDVQLGILVFEGTYELDIPPRTLVAADLIGSGITPCVPNRIANLTDMQRIILIFEGQTFEETGCPAPCP